MTTVVSEFLLRCFSERGKVSSRWRQVSSWLSNVDVVPQFLVMQPAVRVVKLHDVYKHADR